MAQLTEAREKLLPRTRGDTPARRRRLPPMLRLDLGRPSRQHWLGYLLLLPAVLMIGAIIIYPLVVSIGLSLQDVKIPRFDQPPKPLTTVNYLKLLNSGEFWRSLWVTVRLIAVVTAGTFVIGVATALLVNNRFRGRTLARLIIALPWAIPEVVVAVVFSWFFNSSFGLVNWALFRTGIANQMVSWFSDPVAAFAVVCIAMIWKGYPFVSIMVLAGLQSIPDDYYQAARVDGARPWQRFVYITVPCLMPVLGVTGVLTVLWIFRDYSSVSLLTGGGPNGATQTLAIMTYEQSFSNFNMGYAAALGVVTFALCALASLALVGRRTEGIY